MNWKYFNFGIVFLLIALNLFVFSGALSSCHYSYYECHYQSCMINYSSNLIYIPKGQHLYVLEKPCQNVGIMNNIGFIFGLIFLVSGFMNLQKFMEEYQNEKERNKQKEFK